jgi:AhpD family alkylhydroperoxidase
MWHCARSRAIAPPPSTFPYCIPPCVRGHLVILELATGADANSRSAPTRLSGTTASRNIVGTTPSCLCTATSPATLQGFAANNSALTKTLDVKTRERIALAVAQVDGCDHCLSAHSYLGLNLAKVAPEEVALNRKGQSGDT